MIGDDDVESESNDDVMKVKENVMKDKAKMERLAQLLQSCRCSRGVIVSSKLGSMEYDELGDACDGSEDALVNQWMMKGVEINILRYHESSIQV